jgi:single stranded DNA-binding protein
MTNTLVAVGRLTDNPKLRKFESNSVTSFRLAFGGVGKDNTVFMSCDAWGKSGEMVHIYLEKGDPAVFTGALKRDEWETEDGDARSMTKFVVRDVKFLPKNKKNKEESHDEDQPSHSDGDANGSAVDDDDDIPF